MRSRALFAVVPTALVAISGCQAQQRLWEAEGIIRVEPSSRAGSDYVVHLQNKSDFGLNPDVKSNRHKVALNYIAKQCPRGRVVDDQSIETGEYVVGGASRTYYVYIDCEPGR